MDGPDPARCGRARKPADPCELVDRSVPPSRSLASIQKMLAPLGTAVGDMEATVCTDDPC